jgi:lipopolysaccharide transport system ATP-binding protein
MSDIVLKVENLYKRYRLGKVDRTAFKEDVISFFAKLQGKPDPYDSYVTANELASVKSIDEVKSRYVWSLQDINFEVKQGEIVGVIGKNGAGKSTLLKILSKTTTPTRGNIKIKGRIASLLEVGTGFHPELTGRENIYMNGAILGMRRHEITRKLDEIVAFAGVEAYIDTPVKRYSSGMYVRLAFAVAAHLEPDILIVDEVLAVGDADFQKKCLGKMKDVSAGEGRTVLFVSHNMGAVKGLCTKGIMLKNGILSFEGEVQNAIDHYMQGVNSQKGVFEIGRNSRDEKIIIEKTVLRNQHGEVAQNFETGDDLTIELHCYSHETIQKPYFWIGIESQYGSLMGANSLLDGIYPQQVSNHFVVKCTFKALPLLPQSFTIWAGVRATNGQDLLTDSKEVAYFNIITKVSDIGLNGILAETLAISSSPIVFPYTWEFEKEGKKEFNLLHKAMNRKL